MTDRLDEIAAREAAATPGPWVFATDKGAPEYVQLYSASEEVEEYSADVMSGEGGADVLIGSNDAEFIAGAREDIPYLLALVAKQAAVVEAARAAGSFQWCPFCDCNTHDPDCEFRILDAALAALDKEDTDD